MISVSTQFDGFTESQSELVAHWDSCRRGAALPYRESLDPGAIRAHLASISIVEIEPQGQVRFRLAGSGLRDILGREMRGRLISDLDKTVSEMWSLGLASALDRMRPVGGLIERERDCHAWLRLPLASPGNHALLLCHDTLIPKIRLGKDRAGESHNLLTKQSNLAA